MNPRTLVTGAQGQLGRELAASLPAAVEARFVDRSALDVTDGAAVARVIESYAPDLVINAAAYTAVDLAESEPDRAGAVNALGAQHIAAACAAHSARLIHISTDFVFDGTACRPYKPDAEPNPLSVYGRSKLSGEQVALESLPDTLIVRTSWVYSVYGNNFVKTMLRLMAQREQLGIVADQVGSPTWAHGLAQCCWEFARRPQLSGRYHWNDAGACSWYDFAVAIQEEALALGLLQRAIPLHPLRTEEYPTPARRPPYSLLDTTDTWRDLELEGVQWRRQLRAMLTELGELTDA